MELDGRSLLLARLDKEVAAAVASQTLLPHPRRVLMKSLLRTVFATLFSNVAGVRPTEEGATGLYKALVSILQHPSIYGPRLFANATTMIADIIHHNPLLYRCAAGLLLRGASSKEGLS